MGGEEVDRQAAECGREGSEKRGGGRERWDVRGVLVRERVEE